MISLAKRNPFSGKINVKNLNITLGQYGMFLAGVKVQDAFPQLSPDEREFILTGVTPEEWDEMFKQ